MKVHLGAFDRSVEGWLNTDITPHLFIAKVPFLPWVLCKLGIMPHGRYLQHKDQVFRRLKYVDLTKPLPFRDRSVAAFFSSHVLEHLFLDEVEALIGEMHRCLAPAGVCRVVVPDLEKAMATYDRNDPRRFLAGVFEAASRSRGKNSHHCAFTGPFLERLFRTAGFRDVATVSYRTGRCPDLELLDTRPGESIFFEAIK